MIGAILASPWSIWGIAGLATAGVITRPFAWPEFVWAVGGAVLLLLLGLLSPAEAWSGVARGTDVYLFLTGMMLIGVDLGPNLSVTGSLATILWLTALRRAGHSVSWARW